MEQPRLEGTLKDHLVQCFVGKGAQMRFSSTLSNPILKTSIDEDPTTSLGRLLPWTIVLTVKKFLPYIEMKALLVQIVPVAPCPLHVVPCEERASILFVDGL